jgi:hypothetical protein
MARTIKRTVDYFPHVVKPGKTLFILETRWGIPGYAFMWKLYETLCESDDMYLDFKNDITREVFLAKTRVNEQDAIAMLDVMAKLNNIDSELWARSRVVWSQDLVDNLSEVWRRRASPTPARPDLCRQYDDNNPPKPPFSGIKSGNNPISTAGNGQSKVEERRGGRVFHNDNDNSIVSDKDKPDAPPAGPASPCSAPDGAAAGKAGAVDSSDAIIKDQDVLAVIDAYCAAKKLRFANAAAKAVYVASVDVSYPARDLLALAGGDVTLALRAIKDHADWYAKQGKDSWDLRWLKKDFTAWDSERREYEQERI